MHFQLVIILYNRRYEYNIHKQGRNIWHIYLDVTDPSITTPLITTIETAYF